MVSENEFIAEDIFAIINVLELPPNESFSKNVNFESLYLMWRDLPSDNSTNEFITQPNTVKDLFMFVASFKRSPTAAVYFYLSEPAKSTKWSLDDLCVIN